ncbi:MAG: hypothetical protein K2L98_02270, partial [Bacilli bacterium]|nr:hypothetical protein [Bacilli bacterium]
MNRFVFMGNYVETYKNSQIYYDQVLDKFYCLPYNFFDKKKDGLEYLNEFLPDNFEDPEIKGYEITNKDEIKGLRFILKINKEKENKIDTFFTDLKSNGQETEAKIDQKKISPHKKALIGCIGVLAVCYLMSIAYNKYEPTIKSKFNNYIESLSNKDETKEEYLAKVSDALELNTTIPEDIKALWLRDFTLLFNSDIFMTPHQVKGIVKRISEGN